MQQIYNANPEKVIIGMVGRTANVTKFQHGGNPILAKKYIVS